MNRPFLLSLFYMYRIIFFFLMFGFLYKAYPNQKDTSYYSAPQKVFTAKDSIFYASSNSFTEKTNDSLRNAILESAFAYLKKPYCASGRVHGKCFDCSGLVYTVFKEFNISLPPSSSTQAVCGNFIAPKNALPGDLIFFNGRKSNSEEIGHVGIISAITENEIYFIHSSTKRGVIVSTLSEKYYAERFMCIKNIIDLPAEK